ncbi:hypothetical protein ACWECC_13200 [Streptomyces microflavus]
MRQLVQPTPVRGIFCCAEQRQDPLQVGDAAVQDSVTLSVERTAVVSPTGYTPGDFGVEEDEVDACPLRAGQSGGKRCAHVFLPQVGHEGFALISSVHATIIGQQQECPGRLRRRDHSRPPLNHLGCSRCWFRLILCVFDDLGESDVGLILFAGDGDTSSPDVGWSYSGFAEFRRELARAEGFDLGEMWGFGGDRPWSDVSTSLERLLDRPDDGGGELSSTECAVLLPRIEAIADHWRSEAGVPRTHIDAAQQLAVVLRLCIAKDVELLFL